MRIFRFWAQLDGDIALKDGRQKARILVGSNISEEDARAEAERRLGWVQAKVLGQVSEAEGYEVDIRETVLELPAGDAAITRNRYGAHVLNAESLPIFDVDEVPTTFWDLFSRRTPEWRLARMQKVLRELATQHVAEGLGFRLYTTAKGFRVIVVGAAMMPREVRAGRLAHALHVDPLYWTLCRKQGCYRARLTPKPHRMKAPTIRVPFPPTPEQAAEIAAWEEGYLARTQHHATCHFVQAFGPTPDHPLVKLHDQRTGAHSDRRLA